MCESCGRAVMCSRESLNEDHLEAVISLKSVWDKCVLRIPNRATNKHVLMCLGSQLESSTVQTSPLLVGWGNKVSTCDYKKIIKCGLCHSQIIARYHNHTSLCRHVLFYIT